MIKKLLAIGAAVFLFASASFAGTITGTGHNHGDLQTYFENIRDLVNVMRARAEGTDKSLVIIPTLSALADNDKRVAFTTFSYVIDGVTYLQVATSTEVAPTVATTVATNKYGAFAYDISTTGLIRATNSPENDVGYGTVATAVASLPTASANWVRIGYITVSSSGSEFIASISEFADTVSAWTAGTSIIASEVDLTLIIN